MEYDFDYWDHDPAINDCWGNRKCLTVNGRSVANALTKFIRKVECPRRCRIAMIMHQGEVIYNINTFRKMTAIQAEIAALPAFISRYSIDNS